MKCSKCHGEWASPTNVILSKCPFCQTDILTILNDNLIDKSVNKIIDNIIAIYGFDIIFDHYRFIEILTNTHLIEDRIINCISQFLILDIYNKLLSFKSKDYNQIRGLVDETKNNFESKSNFIFSRKEIDLVFLIWCKLLNIEYEYDDNKYQIIHNRDSTYSVANPNGRIITNANYQSIGRFHNGRALVDYRNPTETVFRYNLGFIDKMGLEIVPCIYKDAFEYQEGLAAVKKDNLWGFIDYNGNTVIEFCYKSVNSFSEGLAAVRIDKKYGFIDKKGNLQIPYLFNEVSYDDVPTDNFRHMVPDNIYFNNGYACVYYNKKYRFIDRFGSFIDMFESDIKTVCVNGFARIKIKDEWMSFDFKNKIYSNNFIRKSDTHEMGTFIDERDGKQYRWIKIGEQVWMAQNLSFKSKTGRTTFNDSIKHAIDYLEEVYSIFEHETDDDDLILFSNELYKELSEFGYLYEWDTAKEICPAGWRLPTNEDWNILEDFLISNGYNCDGTYQGNKLGKSLCADSKYWTELNHRITSWTDITADTATNNLSGFSALPSGRRRCKFDEDEDENYSTSDEGAFFWSADIDRNNQVACRGLNYYALFEKYLNRQNYLSVRCIRIE